MVAIPYRKPLGQRLTDHQPYTTRLPPHPSTHPNSILIRNPHPYLTSARHNTNSLNQPYHLRIRDSVNSGDYPPGYPRQRFQSIGKQVVFDICDPVEGRKNYETRLELEREKPKGADDEVQGAHQGNKARPAKIQEEGIVTRTICITNISRKVADDEILKCISVFGNVELFRRFNSWRGADLSHCLVKLETYEQAVKAIARLGGTRRMLRSWRVTWARSELDVEKTCVDEEVEEGEFNATIVGEENEDVYEFLRNSWMIVMETQRSLSDQNHEC